MSKTKCIGLLLDGKRWRYSDGCNTCRCVDNFCTCTLVNCLGDTTYIDGLPYCSATVDKLAPCREEPAP